MWKNINIYINIIFFQVRTFLWSKMKKLLYEHKLIKPCMLWYVKLDNLICHIYNILKSEFGSEKYFNLLPQNLRITFIEFRTANHHLPLETGSWCGIPKLGRTCHVCDKAKQPMNIIIFFNVISLNCRKIFRKNIMVDQLKKLL